MMNNEKQYELYLTNMSEIKTRIRKIKLIRSQMLNMTSVNGDAIFRIEFSVLQVRKILELIALSSLVSDYNIYEKRFHNINKLWRADLIIKDIERINPNFYPQPTLTTKRHDGLDELVKSNKDYLDKEKFVKVYEQCGRILHVINPFIGIKSVTRIYMDYASNIDEWLMWIENLLENHTVQLFDCDYILYIVMGGELNNPSGNVCRKVGKA